MGIFSGLQGWHLIIIIAVIVLLFGAPKLPGLAKSLGQSLRIFRGEMKQMKDEAKDDKQGTASTTSSAKSEAGQRAKNTATTTRKPAAKKTAS